MMAFRALASPRALAAHNRVALRAAVAASRTYAMGRPIDKIIVDDHERIWTLWNEFKKTMREAQSQSGSPAARRQSGEGMPHNPGAASAEASTLSYDGPKMTTGGADTRQSTTSTPQSMPQGRPEPDDATAGKLIRLKNSLLREIAVHSVAEEIVVYPEIARYKGEEVANRLLQDQQEVKEQCYELDRMDVTDPDLMPRLTRVIKELELHTAAEENDELPELRARLNDDWLVSLGDRFLAIKHVVPTRAHPSAPTIPTLEALVGMMTAPIDKAMDLGRDFARPDDISAKSAQAGANKSSRK